MPCKSPPYADRVLNLGESLTVATTARAGELKRQGVDVISLSAGEPDFDTPEHIKQAAIQAIRDGKTKYSVPASGIPELKQAVCDKLARDNGLQYDPSQILVACGAKQVIFDAVMSLINPGDEAIIASPYWVSYADQVRLMGGNPVVLETRSEDGFRLDPERLKDALGPRTRFFLINSPCNPTGAVYSPAEIQAIADVLAETDVFVISDEVYEKILYDGAEHVSIASSSPAVKDRSLVVNGVSKTYAMTGWRVGYGAAPPELIRLMAKVQSQETTNTCTVSQYAALEALTGPQDSVEHMRQAFSKRRGAIVDRLNAMPGINCRMPKGAFYVFPDVSGLLGRAAGTRTITNDLDLCEYLLDEARVAGVAGSGFGAPRHIRFSYATSMELIDRAMDRVHRAVNKLHQSVPDFTPGMSPQKGAAR